MSHSKPSRNYLEQLRKRYARARRKERAKILDEFVQTSNYQRKYAIALLRGKRRWRAAQQPIERKRARTYTDEDKRAVLWLAELFDQIGSKRLRVAMNNELDNLWRHKQLRVSRACYERLHQISPSTMDRLRASERRTVPHAHSGSKPGTLLKAQIPTAKRCCASAPLPSGMINAPVLWKPT
ncbi:MAG: hypothetical protein LC737_00225 [Chloroflexi bacterium]|nr:hypothetical protein [Chloroflexota bacterium]